MLAAAGPAHAQTVVPVPAEGAKLALTIPQTGPTLVSDRRTVTLPAGRSLLRVTGVAAQLDPATVQPLLTGPGTAEVLEQRFRYDLGSRDRLLRQYVGQSVTLIPTDGAPVTGTLLAAGDTVLLQTEKGVLVNPQGTLSVPRPEAGLATSPTLEWLVEAPTAGPYTLETRYATGGLTWIATYQAALNAAADRLAMRGWLTVDNQSGADFRGAHVALHALGLADETPTFPYARSVDLPHGEKRQLSYFSTAERPVTQELVFFAAETQPNYTAPHTAAPLLTLRLRNETAAGLGLPLPAGQLTVLGTAADGTLRQVAQRNVPLLVPDARLTVSMRPAQAVMAARTQVSMRQLNPLTNEHTLQVALTNNRAQEVTVVIIERLPAGAKITESSVQPAMLDGGLAEFRVPVPANGTAALKYVVELKKQ
jgi:hypothetical protein